MNSRVIAFLDLLGFSNNTKLSSGFAANSIIDCNVILKDKYCDEKVILKQSGAIDDFSRNHLVTSFENYLPFSDSVFITSEKPEIFIKQISNFLISCFKMNSDEYKKPINKLEPRKIITTHFSVKNQKVVSEKVEEYWFPLIFRGGVSYGEVIKLGIHSIQNYELKELFNLSGNPVINAVQYEKLGKGPRLFCGQEFVDSLPQNERQFIHPLKDCISEILWPMGIYFPCNDPKTEILKFRDMFIPVCNLWKAFNHLDFGNQYYSFLKLVILSTMKYFRNCSQEGLAVEFIEKEIENCQIEDKKSDLMNEKI